MNVKKTKSSKKIVLKITMSMTLPHSIQYVPAHSSFPFSYKEDACAQDVVESMEQVGDLASLCLK